MTELFLGCPVWACESWKGSLFTRTASRRDWLPQYSSVFRTVEGNSTFYALPPLDRFHEWGSAATPGFRFCLKVSRSITHDCRLRNADTELSRFTAAAEVLSSYQVLGPSFIQLPPDFSPVEAPALQDFLNQLPTHLPWAVEVRHHAWFDLGRHEQWLIDLLTHRGLDFVIFDSRPLYSAPPADDVERISQSRKPKTPLRHTVTGRHPFLRIVGRNQVSQTLPWLTEWGPVIASWLQQGLQPFVFTHAPDDRFAPDFAALMHAQISLSHPALPALPPWPGQQQPAIRQKSLFD
jgi:uncharacterized protein YecE (DUF72 family)